MTAEKKWEGWDCNSECAATIEGSKKISREAYKSALRQAIEKLQKESNYLHEWNTDEILTLLETVEPPEI